MLCYMTITSTVLCFPTGWKSHLDAIKVLANVSGSILLTFQANVT